MRNLLWQLRAARILLGGAIRGIAEYRADLAFTLFSGAMYQCTGFLAVWVILSKFDSIVGWDLADIALLYGIRLVAHAIWLIPFSQLAWLSDHVREGTFDRYLLRPVNPLVQLMTTRIRPNAAGDLIGGVTILSAALSISDIDWSAWKVGFLAVALLGGAALECGIQLAISSIAFTAVKADEARFATDWIFSLYGNYPASMFGRAGQWVMLTILPVGYVAYLPTSVLLGRADDLGVPAALAYLSPLIGGVVMYGGYLVWNRSLSRYNSAGN